MTTDCTFYRPEDLMKAEPGTELSCSDLHIHTYTPTPTLRGTASLSVWRREGKETATILQKKEEEKGRTARKTNQEICLKSTKKMDLFPGDIFQNQKVHVGDVLRHSRHFAVETRRPAKVSVASTKGMNLIERSKPTELSHATFQLVDSAKAEREEKDEEHLQELLSPTYQTIIQTEELEESDVADFAEETMEEFEEPIKDKSVQRRLLNRLNEQLQDRSEKKIARTYRRELEEDDDIYTLFMAQPMTRAEREQSKRQRLIRQDLQRQRVKEVLDAHLEVKRCLKEALKLKEEEPCEKWADEHGQSVAAASPELPKKRMSKWEKRFLRAKDHLHRHYPHLQALL